MLLLIAGLLLFLANHSVRFYADDWRTRFIADKGEMAWKGLYSVVSLVSLVLIVYGYGASRADPVFLWNPPVWTRHAASLLVLLAFFLVVAAFIPRNHIKAAIGHPMFAGVKLWAFAHLMANGRLGDVLLFGSFLVWAIAGFSISRKRDRRNGVTYEQGTLVGTSLVSVLGTVAFAVFAFVLHQVLIGVAPF